MNTSRLRIVIPATFVLMTIFACVISPDARSALKFSPDNLPAAKAGVPYSVDITVTKNVTPVGDAWVSAGALPGGLTLEKVASQDIITISGTPQVSGQFSFTIGVWCYGTNVSGQTGEKEYTFTVNP